MATLLELDTIEGNSTATIPDPVEPPDPQRDAVIAARNLRGKVRVALTAHARTLLNGGTILPNRQIGGVNIPYPQAGQEANEAIGLAQRVLAQPETFAGVALRLALAAAAPPSNITAAQILAAGDAAIQAGLEGLIPALAKGAHPGR